MPHTTLGIIGGGQLGMLLAQEATNFPITTSIYDPNPQCSAARCTPDFTTGDFSDTQRIIDFGTNCDTVIFETEQVSIDPLYALQDAGVHVLSDPHTLEWIQDKGIQKQTLRDAGIPVPPFALVSADQVKSYQGSFPIVQKWRTGGYDGYGVTIHRNAQSLATAQEVDSLFEQPVQIAKELSVIIARDARGNVALYDPVEMVFDPESNMVDFLICPAHISDAVRSQMNEICRTMADKLSFHGIYAVEFFLDVNDQLLVNEISPRPHNSGHHTVEACVTSQYEQQIRIALGLPLGSTDTITPCVMVNLLADKSTGATRYDGLEDAFAIPNVHYTFYHKHQVRPSRKMGHAVILEKSLEKAHQRMNDIRTTLTITADV